MVTIGVPRMNNPAGGHQGRGAPLLAAATPDQSLLQWVKSDRQYLRPRHWIYERRDNMRAHGPTGRGASCRPR
jgi:hypothetical protein